jgi:hypothetical protein
MLVIDPARDLLELHTEQYETHKSGYTDGFFPGRVCELVLDEARSNTSFPVRASTCLLIPLAPVAAHDGDAARL